MTATRAYFVSMFILPPCEEGTTIQIVWFGVAAPGLIEISPGASSFQTSELTGKLQAPAVILPFLSKMAVYLYSKSCSGLFIGIIAHAS
ncbi:hypothetical protein POY07_27585, partial [Escherichia coli]